MSAVFRREIKALFHGVSGYLFLSVVVLSACLFITWFQISYGYASFELTLSYISIGLALVLPVLAMALFSPSKKGDGARLLRMLPLSGKDLMAGKYLTALAMLGLVTVLLAVCPLILSMLGEVRYLTAYVGLLGFFLVGHALLSICTYIASAVHNRLAAWGISYGVLLVLWGIGRVAEFLPQPLRDIAEVLSVFGTYTPFVFGVLDWRMVLFCLSVSAVFVMLTARSEQKKWTR